MSLNILYVDLLYVNSPLLFTKGFIVVASCVMTFEARDSAAKVVPARFKISGGRNRNSGGPGSRRTTSKQIFRKNTKKTFQVSSFKSFQSFVDANVPLAAYG